MPKCQNKGSKPSKKRKRKDTVGWTDGPSITSIGACRGQPWGSPKKPGESYLKPTKNKYETHLLLKQTHRARPTLRWPPRPTGVAQSNAPSSGFRLARGLTPPSSGFLLARGLISASLEAPSQAHLLPHAGTGIQCSNTAGPRHHAPGNLSHLIFRRKPNASPMCARIKFTHIW
jgi:hypothetical protein